MPIFKKKTEERISVDLQGFTRLAGDEPVRRVEFSSIVRVECYKRDELTTDLICFDVWYDAGNQTMTVWVYEELPGWSELTEQVARIPGFDGDWFGKVSQPPFAKNRTLVYERV